MGEKTKKKGSISYAKWGYIFIAPFFIIFAVFQLIPLISTIYYSFFEYYRSGLKVIGPNFAGLKNYITLFSTDLPKYFSNTLILWIIGFIPQIAISLLLAAWFTDLRLKLKGQTFFKTVIYMPNLIMASAFAMLFFALFSVLRYQIPEGAHFYGVFESLAITTNDAVSSLGIVGAWAYVLFVLAFGILTLVPMLLNTQSDSPQASQTKIMGIVMALMMIWFGWNVPVGVVLYYVTSSAWGVVQQVFITRKVMEKAKADEAERMANQPVSIDVVRKEHKPRPHKKG